MTRFPFWSGMGLKGPILGKRAILRELKWAALSYKRAIKICHLKWLSIRVLRHLHTSAHCSSDLGFSRCQILHLSQLRQHCAGKCWSLSWQFSRCRSKKKKQNCLEYYNGAQSPLTWSKSSNKASGDFEQVGGTYAVH